MMNKPAAELISDTGKEMVDRLGDREWAERNFHVVVEFAERLNPCTVNKLKDYYSDLLKNGVWYAEDMLLIREDEIDLFSEAGFADRTRFWADISTYKTLSKEAQKYIHGIKIFTDGAFGSKTANIKTPFLTGERGIQVFSDEELRQKLAEIAQLGIAVSIHAIGDGAIDQVLGVLSNIKEEISSIPEIRMEHVQLITRSNAERAKELGVILSMQPNFNVDSIYFTERLAEHYIRQNNPFRMLIDEVGFTPGKDLIFGSDGMPYGVDDSLKCSLFPPYPSQKLTLDEYIAGYCMPDMENGHIEVEIDEEKQSINTEVVVKDI
jgi:predicted amidohydrolase YtcJ